MGHPILISLTHLCWLLLAFLLLLPPIGVRRHLCYINHIFLVHSPIFRHLGCFHGLSIVNSATVNMGLDPLNLKYQEFSFRCSTLRAPNIFLAPLKSSKHHSASPGLRTERELIKISLSHMPFIERCFSLSFSKAFLFNS